MLTVQYTSVWDGGVEVNTLAKFDLDTRKVVEVETADVDGLECCEDEYITLPDGTILHRRDEDDQDDGTTFILED